MEAECLKKTGLSVFFLEGKPRILSRLVIIT